MARNLNHNVAAGPKMARQRRVGQYPNGRGVRHEGGARTSAVDSHPSCACEIVIPGSGLGYTLLRHHVSGCEEPLVLDISPAIPPFVALVVESRRSA